MLEPDTDIKDRVHTEDELNRILSEIRMHEIRKPTYISAYALELQILLGCRPGEVTPLRKSDITL